MNKLQQIINMILDLLFPDSCTDATRAVNAPSLFNTLRSAGPLPISNGVALFDYSDIKVQELIFRLKFKGDNKITSVFAQSLADVLIEDIAERAFIGTSQKPLLVAVPMTKKALKRRGFNQLTLILKELMKSLPNDINHTQNVPKTGNIIEYAPNIVIKVRDTTPQKKLGTRKQREKNLLDCFKVVNLDTIRGRDLIVFDDVYTTGSTIAEFTKTLKNAGATNIYVYTLAYQPPKN